MFSFKEIKTEAEIDCSVGYHTESSYLDSNFEKALDSSILTFNLRSKLVSDCLKNSCYIKLKRLPLGKQLAREGNRTTFKTDPAECFDDFLRDFVNPRTVEEPQKLNDTGAEVLLLTDCEVGNGTWVCHTLTYKLMKFSNEENTGTPNSLPQTSKPSESCEEEGCDIVSKSQKNLIQIQDGHREKEHFCHICGRGYFHKNHLNVHLKMHRPERPYCCQYCGAAFHHNDRLQAHLRIHSTKTDTKPYMCDKCGYSFNSSWQLSKHQQRHSGQRPYRCDQCEKWYISRSELKWHQKIHTGEKPFTCTECGTSFQRSGTLRKHMRIHTGERPYFCSACGKTFPYAHCLNLHMKLHQQ
ncbi:zinc finger protein 2 homolog [Hypomesus transpacificus]|uniref:zinc finger protein 2 homolog n=1 Tax=Hypomesus transpacificus TaxID=137520 RepID=UPI001F076791|nr:zinc finger protein 2 homolog [Hypomesus transpacificus]